MKKGKNGMN